MNQSIIEGGSNNKNMANSQNQSIFMDDSFLLNQSNLNENHINRTTIINEVGKNTI